MAQAAQGGGGQQSGDNSLAVVWIMVLFMVTAMFIWYQFHAQIVSAVFQIKYAEIRLVSLFTSQLNPVINQMNNVDVSQITWDQLNQLADIVGDYLRYPVLILLLVLAGVLYVGNPVNRFRKIYTMKSLAEQERANWPQISPVLKLDLVNMDIDEGPWAMGMTPMAFAKKYFLLKPNPSIGLDKASAMSVSRVKVIRPEAKKIFSLQLGAYWEGPEALPVYIQALLAAFIAKLNHDSKASHKLLTDIANSTYKGKLDFTGYQPLLQKHFNTTAVQKIVQRHGYVLTVMAGLLHGARGDGVLASADFLWLKPIDRTLWYMLNSVGRQTPYVEVAGIFAHWIAEKEMGHRIMVPIVEEAVNGLEKAVKEIKITDEEYAEIEKLAAKE